MSATLETRKPVTALTPGDFEAFPIWEYALDEETLPGRDETWVRPVDSQVIEMGWYVLVATDFRTPGGRTFPGFSSVSTGRRGIEVEPGVALGEGSYVPLDYPDEVVAELGIAEAELFPLAFTLWVVIDGETRPREGVIGD